MILLEDNDRNEDQEKETALRDESQDQSFDEEVTENTQKEEVKAPAAFDHGDLTLEALVERLEKIIDDDLDSIKNEVSEIKYQFDKKFANLLATTKEKFLEEGGQRIDFQFHDPLKLKPRFNDLIKSYRKRKDRRMERIRREQDANLLEKETIIDDLKKLIDQSRHQDVYKKFRELGKRWKSVGNVPYDQMKIINKTYQHHVQRFFDLRRMNQELRSVDYGRNLDKKRALIAKAQELYNGEDVRKAIRLLNQLHRNWKRLGAVPPEYRENIWQEFKEISAAIRERYRLFLKEQKENRQEIRKKNQAIKESLIAQIKEISNRKHKTIGDWNDADAKIEKLATAYRDVKSAPYHENKRLWKSFDKEILFFTQQKNDFFRKLKKDEQAAIREKKEIIEKIINITALPDFDKHDESIIALQRKWRASRYVSKKEFEKINASYINARDAYFEKVQTLKNTATPEQIETLAKKEELLSQIRTRLSEEKTIAAAVIKDWVTAWKALGNVAKNDQKIDRDFYRIIKSESKNNEALNESDLWMYQIKIEEFVSADKHLKLKDELEYLERKINKLQKKKRQIDNNGSFFANLPKDNPMVLQVEKSIERLREEIDKLVAKLKYLRKTTWYRNG